MAKDLHPHDPNNKANRLKNMRLFFYNPRTKRIMGRTPKRWGLLGLCYLTFFSILSGVTAGMFSVFYYFLVPVDVPVLIGVHSLLKGKPGVSKRPAYQNPTYATSNMTFINRVQPFIDDLEDYLKVHIETNGGKDAITCDDTTVLKKGQVCKLNMTELFPSGSMCKKTHSFGYSVGKPCIAVKVNRIYGWKPDLYDKGNLPSDFPKGRYHKDRLTVDCFGAYPTDQDNIGMLKYIPEEGIDIKYFPYMGQKEYLDPFVWIQFLNATPTLDLRIRCKVFAKNIGYHHRTDISYTQFELVVDE